MFFCLRRIASSINKRIKALRESPAVSWVSSHLICSEVNKTEIGCTTIRGQLAHHSGFRYDRKAFNRARMSPLILSSDQQQVIADILQDVQTSGSRLVLCGYAGTGKTVTTAALVKKLSLLKLTVVVATPTHKARSQVEKALRANGADDFICVTVHRLLGLRQVRNYATGEESFEPHGENMLQTGILNDWTDFESSDHTRIDIVIVDETSMLHDNLYQLLIEQAGDRAIIFVGDDRQLLPVKENKPCAAFVEAHSIYRLTEVLRHDGAILSLATATRSLPVGRAKFIDVISGGSQVIAYRRRDLWINALLETMTSDFALNDPDYARALAFINKDVQELNRKIHERRYGFNAPQFMTGMTCITVDAIPCPLGGKPLLNSTVEVSIESAELDSFKAPHDDESWDPWNTWILEVRDLDSGKALAIRALHRDEITRWRSTQKHFADLAKSCEDAKERKIYWSMYFERKDQIGQLEPASALTIHKSQGSTFKNVFLHWDIDGWGSAPSALQNQLSYVGITRAAESLHVLRDF